MMKNKVKLKRVLVSVVIVSLLLVSLMMGLSVYEYKTFNNNYNKKVMAIVASIEEKYPDVTEKEIIDILSSEDKYSDMFLKYGIFEGDSLVLENEKFYPKFLVLNIGVCLLIILIISLLFLSFNKKKDKELQKITEYIEQINRRNYLLDIDENSEDELSILKNEIYKTTVMLKEVAENSSNEKLELKKSLSDISHQLKTPLTSILIMLDDLIDDPEMDFNLRNDFIRDIRREITNINFLVQSILKLSKLDTNTVSFVREKVKINDLILQATKNVSVLADLRNIDVIVEGSNDLVINCDKRWQVEALTNILKNALEHSLDGGKVEVLAQGNKAYATVSIRDYGRGIDKEDLPHIFERFYKGKNATDDSIGIGLCLSKSIIEKDDGRIEVFSDSTGTTFVIKYFYFM